MEWVLIIMMLGKYATAIDHVEFSDKLQCEVAATRIMSEYSGHLWMSVKAFCVGRSQS